MPIHLGKKAPISTTYDPSLLDPIARSKARQTLPSDIFEMLDGHDIWTLWECSWLDFNNQPKQAVVRLIIPANSSHIVESKSLKLYLYSLNNEKIGKNREYLALLNNDLTLILGAKPQLSVLCNKDLQPCPPSETNIDDETIVETKGFNNRLKFLNTSDYSNAWCSDNFQSLCPVTNQPDYATIYTKNCPLSAYDCANYWFQYRNHNSFHEHCIEQMFADFYNPNSNPQQLLVGGSFLRRGGIDIHPVRWCKNQQSPPKINRFYRQ